MEPRVEKAVSMALTGTWIRFGAIRNELRWHYSASTHLDVRTSDVELDEIMAFYGHADPALHEEMKMIRAKDLDGASPLWRLAYYDMLATYLDQPPRYCLLKPGTAPENPETQSGPSDPSGAGTAGGESHSTGR